MKKIVVLIILMGFSTIFALDARAGIAMSVDRTRLDFTALNPGDSYELAEQGTYHNEITCSSTNNKTWYLRQRLVRPLTSGMNTIPNENFRWEVVSIGSGTGIVYNNINIQNPFTATQGLIYTSGNTDNSGTQIKLRFRYYITIPKNQVAGAYDAVIRLTMNEIL